MILLPATLLLANDLGERVVKRGVINDDIYLAGGEVEMNATVDGDVTVAGGQLDLDGKVSGDVMAAGGTVILRSQVADDVRMAGGEVEVLNTVGDDVFAAGGRVRLGQNANIGGRAWLSGGDVRIDGTINQELHAAGGRIVLTGKVQGDVYLRGEQIEISPTAVVQGNLYTKGPHEARISPGAKIKGKVQHTPIQVPVKKIVAKLIGTVLVLLLSLMIAGVVLYLVFPRVAERATQSLRDAPWPCLGFGLAVFAGTPVVIAILLGIGIGVWLALILLLAYLLILILGYFTGALFVGEAGLRLIKKQETTKTARAIALCVALLLLAIVNVIPLIGGLIFWLVLLAGVGALKREMYLAYKSKK
jgi:cytoskeletal protein CcmA (bactofilin family)